ncbi:MAG TPA: CDP-glycerol glycerophosphotransferase family protein [Steroidobacteraceae bacterium]|nr:CDP-glycerol glycerophosphotransferase family protein [Steroidobacteraceae bacterium]
MRVLFLFIGEHHHVFHSLPLAAELATLRTGWQIEVAVSDQRHLGCIDTVRSVYPGFAPPVRQLPLPALLKPLHALGWISGQGRIPRLLAALPWLRTFDAIVVPERTSTILRHFLSGRTRLIFTPHGAGDRAVTFDARDRHFDFALVAGEKSERRMLQEGTIRPGHYATNGYVKMDLMHRFGSRRAGLFRNARPTVLYAPHFRAEFSSWPAMGREVIDIFRRQDRFNLIVAPHIRLFQNAAAATKAQIQALAMEDRIIIDLDSDRLVDMTYTSAADVYLGDVSSQVYEFLARPRPCVFLNSHGVAWQQDPNYRLWTLGEVLDSTKDLLPAIERAPARHAQFLALQRAAFAESVGGDPAGAAGRGAGAIAAWLEASVSAARGPDTGPARQQQPD